MTRIPGNPQVRGGPAGKAGVARPRVGLVATRAFPDVGGIEAHLDQLMSQLDKASWDLDVVVTDTTGSLPARQRRHDIPVRRHRAFPRQKDWYISPGLFLDIVRGRRDLVHIHGVNALVPPIAMVAAALGRVPFIVTLHSGGANTAFRRRIRHAQWRVIAVLLRRAAAVIAVSKSESELFSPLVGRGPLPVIRNGALELELPEPVAVDRDLVLSIGRLEQYKGHHRLIEVVETLRRRGGRTRLRILGTGPFLADLNRMIETKGMTDCVTISSVDPVDRVGMAREIAAAGAIALMSDYEAHPVVVMEAVSLGRPVIARRNSGFIELIDDGLVTGVPDDAGSELIASVLSKMLESRAAAPVAAVPTWQDCALGVSATYSLVLAGRQ